MPVLSLWQWDGCLVQNCGSLLGVHDVGFWGPWLASRIVVVGPSVFIFLHSPGKSCGLGEHRNIVGSFWASFSEDQNRACV